MKIYDLLDALDIFLDILLEPPQPLMETKWGQHGDNMRTMWRQHGDHGDVETTWGPWGCGDHVGTTWRQQGDNMRTMWRQHGDHGVLETTWGQHGDNMGTT